ncbi:MAG TPA: response regulator [Sphingobacteriaceae bacterium]
MRTRVLVVDDDDIVIFLHELMVRESGLSDEPVSFMNGQAALDYILQHRATDEKYLIFLDLNMPVMNGWELLEELKELSGPEIRVVIVTSSIDADDHKRSENYSFVIGYLEKPLSAEACKRFT